MLSPTLILYILFNPLNIPAIVLLMAIAKHDDSLHREDVSIATHISCLLLYTMPPARYNACMYVSLTRNILAMSARNLLCHPRQSLGRFKEISHVILLLGFII